LRQRDPNFANDYLDFLGENEAICKTALGRESGDCLMKKTEGRKSRDTVPLKTFLIAWFNRPIFNCMISSWKQLLLRDFLYIFIQGFFSYISYIRISLPTEQKFIFLIAGFPLDTFLLGRFPLETFLIAGFPFDTFLIAGFP
jgi:hypothetical protein